MEEYDAGLGNTDDGMISTKSALQIIQDLNQSDEVVDVEAKAASDDKLGRSVLETICSFSNDPGLGGGTVLLGVTREDALFPFYSATGVPEPDKLMSDIASACGTTFNAAVRVNMTVERVNSANVIRIDVKELLGHQKPLYFVSTGLPRGHTGASVQRTFDVTKKTF